MKGWVRWGVPALAAASLGLIGYGCWHIWPPLAALVPGALVWIDLQRWGSE